MKYSFVTHIFKSGARNKFVNNKDENIVYSSLFEFVKARISTKTISSGSRCVIGRKLL